MTKKKDTLIPTTILRNSIGASADIARVWFESRTESIDRATFDLKGKIGDRRTGAVYVYYDKSGKALYVGETSGAVKSRLHTATAPHKKTVWWGKWETMRFIQLPDHMDRLTLEFLLILSCAPKHNKKPKAMNLKKLLPN
jgi:hypothetical protein